LLKDHSSKYFWKLYSFFHDSIPSMNVSVNVEVALTPSQAFDTAIDELSLALEKLGLKFESRSGGSITEQGFVVGRIEDWSVGSKILLTWHPKSWQTDGQSRLAISFEELHEGTLVTITSQDWDQILGDKQKELLGWFAGEVAATLIASSAPNRLGDWITDRHARSPTGANSRETYRNPVYHWPNFLAILKVLSLTPEDYLLEVGCGGGAFLHEALKSGCHAAAIDHSADMIRVAIETNREDIERGRLVIKRSEADTLPYSNDMFTCAVMTGVLGFIEDPLTCFNEIFRTLKNGGRLVIFTSTKKLVGTPAAPEPVASRLHFYDDLELENLARSAGFSSARVEHPSLYEYAKKSGVPEDALDLFKGTAYSQLLIAEK
jgi:ubiquinone/menaquinone biosynthesis C-methylase UbiE